MDYMVRVLRRLKKDGVKNSFLHYCRLVRVAFLEKCVDALVKAASSFFAMLPLTKTVVFECESDMDDNPRAVYEYMLRQGWNKKHMMVWIVRNVKACKSNYAEKNVSFLSRYDNTLTNQIRLNYYLMTAKWFVFSHPYWFHKKRKEQVIVHINHGVALKNISAKDDPQIGDSYDWLLVPSEFACPVHMKFWRCEEGKTIISDFPRNDFLTSGCRQEIFSKLFEFHADDKVILCMPTYKQSKTRTDSTENDKYCLDVVRTREEMVSLNRFLEGKNTHIIIKPHPLQRLDTLETESHSNVHYITNQELFDKKIVLYELVGCCDALLTDLSSIYFDYLLLDRPIGFLMKSIESYERGYIVPNPLDYMPGEKIYELQGLFRFISNLITGEDGWKLEREKLRNQYHTDTIGDYSRKFVNIMFKL